MAVTRADGVHFDAKMAGADLTGKTFYAAALDANGDVVLCGNGGLCIGIITEEAVAGYPVTFQNGGLGKGIAGGTVNEGNKVQSNGDGEFVEGSTNSIGTARNTANEGEMVEIQIDRT